jgi:hypothetical protein
MKDKETQTPADGQDDILEYVPFVNEECGDTMWDEVLKEMEDEDKKEEWKNFDFFITL